MNFRLVGNTCGQLVNSLCATIVLFFYASIRLMPFLVALIGVAISKTATTTEFFFFGWGVAIIFTLQGLWHAWQDREFTSYLLR